MKNAFDVLGAKITDSADRLQELLDEKELLSDDVSEVQASYAELTNPKKRLRHEIDYFCKDNFSEFNKYVLHISDTSNAMQGASVFVNLGLWFEKDTDELFSEINDARRQSGFAHVDDREVIAQVVQTLKQECVQMATAYFDSISTEFLVEIFNEIVKIENYESFFIDELMAHYELSISEESKKKESGCVEIFDEIERLCDQLIKGESVSSSIMGKISELSMSLKSWDCYVQPLQVNMQRRGGQHESSNDLIRDFRNRIIKICNRSQDNLDYALKNLSRQSDGSTYYIKSALDRLSDNVELIDVLLKITDVLISVFDELELVAEQLKKDRNDLIELKNTSMSFIGKLKDTKQQIENKRANNSSSDSCCGICEECCENVCQTCGCDCCN